MHHTINKTTSKIGVALATVIADSFDTTRITTLELVYPRYIHAELMTHRVFSRNASSSRATPLKVTCEDVLSAPAFFDSLGINKSGMSAGAELSSDDKAAFYHDWCGLAQSTVKWVEAMQVKYNLHKQILNRALEPFLNIRVLVTATDWDNFFRLRLAPDAQPEMQSLAKAMRTAMELSTPMTTKHHLPYISAHEQSSDINDKEALSLISVARCARVSYASHDGKVTTLEQDLSLAKRLLNSGHLSPFEHVAISTPHEKYANLQGWCSYRSQLEANKDAKSEIN